MNPSPPRRLLALFAREPVPGRVKTRLSPPFSVDEAAALYEAMLLDTADLHAKDADADWDRAVWFTPEDARGWFSAALPGGYALAPQRGADLGQRMDAFFRDSAARGYERVVLRGTDSPTLPLERIAQAFDALEAHDAVFCPDLDGGYNLVGLREPRPVLFGLGFGTGSVLEQTLERARENGIQFALLPAHHDVDRSEDVDRLRDEDLSRAPRTARWVARTFARS